MELVVQAHPVGEPPIIRCYVNPSDLLLADSLSYEKIPLASVPKGKYFLLIQGGRYGS